MIGSGGGIGDEEIIKGDGSELEEEGRYSIPGDFRKNTSTDCHYYKYT